MRLARLGPRIDRLQTHEPHQTAHAPAADAVAFAPQVLGHLTAAVEGPGEVDLVDPTHEAQVLRVLGPSLIVERRAVQAQERTLPADAQHGMFGLDHGAFGLSRGRQIFFEPLKLHLEAANLLVEFCLQGVGLFVLGRVPAREELRGAVEELALPLTDLAWMNAELAGQLGCRLGALGGFEGDFRLEGRRVVLTNSAHEENLLLDRGG